MSLVHRIHHDVHRFDVVLVFECCHRSFPERNKINANDGSEGKLFTEYKKKSGFTFEMSADISGCDTRERRVQGLEYRTVGSSIK